MLVLLWGCYFFFFFFCWWLLGCMWWWVDGWVLIFGRWVGSGGWLGLDEIGGWVGSGRWSGGRIIFGFATVGLCFAHCRFVAVDLLKWEEMGLESSYRRIMRRKKMRETMSPMVKKFAKMKSLRENRLRDLRVSLNLGLFNENGRSEWAQLPPPLLVLKAIFD